MSRETKNSRKSQHHLRFWASRLWKWLVEPAPEIHQIEQQRQARLLAAMLVMLLPMYVIPEGIRAILVGHLSIHLGLTAVFLGTAYALSRTRHYRFGLLIVLSALTLLPFGSILLLNLAADKILTAAIWIVPTLIIGSWLLSPRGSVFLNIINLFLLLNLPLFSTKIQFTTILFPTGFILLVSLLLFVSAQMRQQNLHQIETQATELLHSEALFRSIIEHSHAGIMGIDTNFCFTYVNDELHHMTQYSREELIGRDFRTLLTDQGRQLVVDHYLRRLAGEAVPSRYEFSIQRKDGKLREVEISAATITDENGRIQTIGQILDITERKKIENALRDSEALYQSLVNNLPQYIFRRDVNGRFTFANQHFCRLHSKSLDEIIGATDFDLHPPLLAQKYWNDDQQVMKTGQAHDAVELHQRNSSEVEYVQVIKTPTYDAAGQITGVQGIFWDITEVKNAQGVLKKAHDELEIRVQERTQELASANAQLKELDNLKNKFIEDMSHELRTPLANLNLYLDLLAIGKPEKRETYLDVLRQAANRITRISEDVLAMIRLELFKEDIQFKPINLNSLAASVVRQQKKLANGKGLDITFVPSPSIAQVQGNESQMFHCLTNLINNSINYTPKGQIVVRVRVEDAARKICLTVIDTGTGIDPDDLPYLFDRFYRGRHIGQSRIPGSGLGLALVKEIIEIHGGSVSAENRSEKGSIFRIWLPLLEASDD